MHFPQVPKKPSPYFFDGAFAPSFIWCRRPWLSALVSSAISLDDINSTEVVMAANDRLHKWQDIQQTAYGNL